MMKPEILIVDDDMPHRRMLLAVLSEEGYLVTGASDGEQAVLEVEKKILRPDFNGYPDVANGWH